MSLFRNRLSGKKNIGSLIADTQIDLFWLYGVSRPSDAQKMKASVYICLAGIALVNDMGHPRRRPIIDRLTEETKEITKALQMRVSELANDRGELEEILSDFPPNVGVTGSTMINGLAAFDALYQTKVEHVVNNILSHRGGPLGTPGYAAIVVADGIFGKGKSRERFMEVSACLVNFIKRLAAAI